MDRLAEVAAVFLKLGLLAFGGPAAHVALMRRELVERRGWVTAEQFAEMFAACNVIPGPTSTELAIFLGYRRAGWRALIAAGVAFILPAVLLMVILAWAYTRLGSSTPAQAALPGVRAVIVGILIWAIVDLGRGLISRWPLLVLALACAGLALRGVDPIAVIVLGGLLAAVAVARPGVRLLAVPLSAAGMVPAAGKLLTIFLAFLKIGALSFGSGYVLLAFLRADFVDRLHWLTDRQLADAVALGQATPGPVFTTATFLGYLFSGLPGALVATVAIFLPAFVLVPFLDRIVRVVRRHRISQGFVDGANAAAIGLIAAVTLQLGTAAVVDPLTAGLAAITMGVLFRWPFASGLLLLGGAVVTLIAHGPG